MPKRIAETISLYGLSQMYPTDEAAIAYLERLRWGDRPHCVRCGCYMRIKPQSKHPGRYWCGDCRSYFTERTDTVLEYAKISPRKWIYAAYLLMTSRKGISSMQMSKELEISQNASWYLLHRLRVACGESLEAIPLTGEVEVDAVYIGGKERNKHASKKLRQGRGAVGKQAVLGGKQRGGRVRARVATGESREAVHQFLADNVERGATVYTDEHSGYHRTGERYNHQSINHSAKEFVNGMAHTNGIESVWAILKRGFNGVYHNWSAKHCQKYVNEFAFRLNEGNCERDTQDRLNDLFRGMVGKTARYRAITQ